MINRGGETYFLIIFLIECIVRLLIIYVIELLKIVFLEFFYQIQYHQ